MITRTGKTVNTPRQVLFASLIGTAIEYFDFYIYANATVLVFPQLFFPKSDPTVAQLASLLTFALAFLARPIGSALFGHFGDRVGRKTTLVAALLTMGISTVAIGVLPTYATVGVVAPMLLSLCRVGQGIGLGGEWGGAVLLAVENAPTHKRAWYGMFPQMGAPVGFLFAGSTFLLLSRALSNAQFMSFGWRLPFLASAVLVLVGLYVRLTLTETPVYAAALKKTAPVKVPILSVFRHHGMTVFVGILLCMSNFVLFYLMSIWALGWGTESLGYTREKFLIIQLFGILFFGGFIPIAARLAVFGRRVTLLWANIAIFLFGFAVAPLFTSGTAGTVLMMAVGMALVGIVYGVIGTVLSELFPTTLRYSGTSFTFNLAAIFGASLAPYIATELAKSSLSYVGLYLSGAAVLSLLGLLAARETKHETL